MHLVEGIVAVTAGLALLAFVVSAIGLLPIPASGRPKVPTFDRFDDHLPPSPNPSFEETEEESEPPVE